MWNKKISTPIALILIIFVSSASIIFSQPKAKTQTEIKIQGFTNCLASTRYFKQLANQYIPFTSLPLGVEYQLNGQPREPQYCSVASCTRITTTYPVPLFLNEYQLLPISDPSAPPQYLSKPYHGPARMQIEYYLDPLCQIKLTYHHDIVIP